MSPTSTTENVTPLHPKTKVNRLDDIPAIRKYLQRIGAEARSPWTAVISEERGRYWNDVATVSLQKDGTLKVPDEYPLTEDETKEIAAQLPDYEWPTLRKLPHPGNLPPEIIEARKANPENVFEFRDLAGNVVMMQVRIDVDVGKKRYVPWTYWSDGKWRNCEPDELLPLWGLDQIAKRDRMIVFLHEGAKPARAARRIAALEPRKQPGTHSTGDTEDPAQHPWAEELRAGAHIGWIGGAPNPHRTDWSALAKAGVGIVYIIADRDPEGEAAIQKISKLLAPWDIEVHALRFDNTFPFGFDLADPFPERLFEQPGKGARRFVGPTFRDLLRPATWATVPVPEQAAEGKRGPKKKDYFLRPVFLAQWSVVKREDETLFINHHDRTRILKEGPLNALVSPFTDKPVSKPLEKIAGIAVEDIAYEPGRDELIITSGKGRRAVNTWTPSRVKASAGDPKPWLDFLARLFPIDSERKNVMKVCATLIARPAQRMKFALLLASETQGVGKTTLTDILRRLVGEQNASTVKEHDIDSQFNSWLAHKRLIVAPEIYAGHSWKTYQNLKSLITDDDVRVNAKFLPQYEIGLWAFFVFCSNSRVPLTMEDTDRRYFMPTVTEERAPKAYWDELRGWLNAGGFGIIRHWADEYVEGEDATFGPGDVAPDTTRKQALIDDSRSRAEHLIRKLGTVMMDQPVLPVPVTREADGTFVGGLVVTDEGVLSWLQDQMPQGQQGQRLPSLADIRKNLRQVGISISVKRIRIAGDMAHACANFSLPEDVTGSQIKLTPPAEILPKRM